MYPWPGSADNLSEIVDMEKRFKVVTSSVGPRAHSQEIEQELPADHEGRMALDKIGAQVTAARCRTEKQLIQVLHDADGILLNNTLLTRQVIENLGNRKAIVRYGIAVDNVDVDAASEHGIVVVNTPDFCVEGVANHAIMLPVACTKKSVLLHNAAVANKWDYNLPSLIPTVYGQTLGLVGFGNLGRAVARKAKASDMQAIAYAPYATRPQPGNAAWICRGSRG